MKVFPRTPYSPIDDACFKLAVCVFILHIRMAGDLSRVGYFDHSCVAFFVSQRPVLSVFLVVLSLFFFTQLKAVMTAYVQARGLYMVQDKVRQCCDVMLMSFFLFFCGGD